VRCSASCGHPDFRALIENYPVTAQRIMKVVLPPPGPGGIPVLFQQRPPVYRVVPGESRNRPFRKGGRQLTVFAENAAQSTSRAVAALSTEPPTTSSPLACAASKLRGPSFGNDDVVLYYCHGVRPCPVERHGPQIRNRRRRSAGIATRGKR
jgi:hypothetical protein